MKKNCKICGKEIIKICNNHKFCDACALERNKKYKKEYRKKYNKNKICNCIICGKEFLKKTSDITCSSECHKQNDKNLKSEYNKIYPKVRYIWLLNKAKELNITPYYLQEYGYNFLKENPEVLETLKILNNFTCHTNIPEDIREARKKLWDSKEYRHDVYMNRKEYYKLRYEARKKKLKL